MFFFPGGDDCILGGRSNPWHFLLSCSQAKAKAAAKPGDRPLEDFSRPQKEGPFD